MGDVTVVKKGKLGRRASLYDSWRSRSRRAKTRTRTKTRINYSKRNENKKVSEASQRQHNRRVTWREKVGDDPR